MCCVYSVGVCVVYIACGCMCCEHSVRVCVAYMGCMCCIYRVYRVYVLRIYRVGECVCVWMVYRWVASQPRAVSCRAVSCRVVPCWKPVLQTPAALIPICLMQASEYLYLDLGLSSLLHVVSTAGMIGHVRRY
jgi:hypothetical protein